jgi:hypothetical protein
MGLCDLGFIPLKAGVFVQDGLAGIGALFTLGQLLVRDLAGIGGTQRANPLRLRVDDEPILVTLGFRLATGVQGLFFGPLGPLSAPVGAINEVIPGFVLAPLGLRNLATLSFRHHLQGGQRSA